MTRVEIKELSKKQLGNSVFSSNWMTALLVVFILGAIAGAASFIPLGSFIIMGAISYSTAFIFLKFTRTGQSMDISDVFEGFKNDFAGNFILGFMTSLFTLLWSCLFFIPGVVKAYSYSMAFYIKNDHPDYDWNRCIKESMALMDGKKADLFVQDLSFIGWIIVGTCACGIGLLWVAPYMELARINFYESIKGEIQEKQQYTETYNA